MFLFHGTFHLVGQNILHEGLVLPDRPTHGALLVHGIYGALSPQKAYTYRNSTGPQRDWQFMFVCRFNLKDANHGNSNQGHEFCVPDPIGRWSCCGRLR